MAEAFIRRNGYLIPDYPEFTYTGSYEMIDEGNGNWRIKLKTSGTLQFVHKRTLDIFLVGGGGGGGNGVYAGGGGGGYTATQQFVCGRRVNYPIVIGAGGAKGASGGVSSGFGFSVNGGAGGSATGPGGAGGSGGGGGDTRSPSAGGAGGSNGASGQTMQYAGGAGQGTTTREFGEASGALYAGGGGGGCQYFNANQNYGGAGGAGGGGNGESYNVYGVAMDGTPNTGGGSGGGSDSRTITGGSGIVIVRNHRT